VSAFGFQELYQTCCFINLTQASAFYFIETSLEKKAMFSKAVVLLSLVFYLPSSNFHLPTSIFPLLHQKDTVPKIRDSIW